MMGNAMESLLYGLCAVGIAAVIAGISHGVKSLCRRALKRGGNHDDQ